VINIGNYDTINQNKTTYNEYNIMIYGLYTKNELIQLYKIKSHPKVIQESSKNHPKVIRLKH
jgi:hypothetical protein